MRRVASVGLVLVVVLLGVSPSTAPGANLPNYLVLKGGVYSPESGDLDDVNADTGFNGEIAFGHYFLPILAVELGVGYFESSGDRVPAGPADVDLFAIPVTLNLKGAIPLGNLEIYGLGGIGYYFTDAEVIQAAIKDSDSDGAFGFQLGAGAAFNVTSSLFIGAEAKYFWLEPKFELGGLPPEKTKFDGWLGTINLGFRY
jgi:opacity protein-like surface antigen